jgi:hypothetical protein
VSENENSEHEHWKLSRDALSVDVGLGSVIENETDEKIDLLRKDLQWTSERETIGLQKLKRKFLDDISTETIEIKAFRCDHKVLTFRTIKLPSMKEISNFQDSDLDGKTVKQNGGEDKNKSDQKNDKSDKDQLLLSSREGGKSSAKVILQRSNLQHDTRSKLEARKLLRAQRALEWKELMEAKPDEIYEDPKDVAAIRYAELYMGDYKLKTGERYIVPDSERVDADKKKRQLILLSESTFGLKETFNGNVLKLRDDKKKLISKFQEYSGRIFEINRELAQMGVQVDALSDVPLMDVCISGV